MGECEHLTNVENRSVETMIQHPGGGLRVVGIGDCALIAGKPCSRERLPGDCPDYQRHRAETAEARVKELEGELAEAKKFLGYVRPKLVMKASDCDIWSHSKEPIDFTCMECGELCCDLRWEMWRIDRILGCADPKLTAAYNEKPAAQPAGEEAK